MKPYTPYYHRSPNKFLRYETRDMTDRAGNKAEVDIAIYLDKNNNQKEETAHIRWRNNV